MLHQHPSCGKLVQATRRAPPPRAGRDPTAAERERELVLSARDSLYDSEKPVFVKQLDAFVEGELAALQLPAHTAGDSGPSPARLQVSRRARALSLAASRNAPDFAS